MTLDIAIHGLSDVGRARNRNEDAYVLEPELGLAVVADGMGGCPAGDVASRMAAEIVKEHFSGAREEGGKVGAGLPEVEARTFMENGVKKANSRVLRNARENPEREGMGTTLTALHVDRDSGGLVVGHVGDSRVYRLRDGSLTQLTRDHTWVQSQVEQGNITHEAARLHPYGHILSQALGVDPELDIEVHSDRARAGDLFLLCTDGLTTVLDDARLGEILQGAGEDASLEDLSQALVDAANEAGGPDNVTVAVLRVTE